MADTVWVVEQGEYSDYRVVGVFSSKENAQSIVGAIKAGDHSDDLSIAEWPMNPGVDELRKGFKQYLIDMRKDGTTERVEGWDLSGYELAGSVRMWRRTQAPAYRGNKDKPDVLQAHIWARDEQHAVKIANEHRARLIASGEWDKDA